MRITALDPRAAALALAQPSLPLVQLPQINSNVSWNEKLSNLVVTAAVITTLENDTREKDCALLVKRLKQYGQW